MPLNVISNTVELHGFAGLIASIDAHYMKPTTTRRDSTDS
jgi:hypothetical protein